MSQSKWVKKQKRKRLAGDKPNPFTKRAKSSSGSTPASARRGSHSLSGTKMRVESGREAGQLELPLGQEKKEKNPWADQTADTSMIVQGMHLDLELRGGERIVTGVANYCDGRWINVLQDGGLGNTPCFRPQITGVTINSEPTS
jgi:hypothetical protein